MLTDEGKRGSEEEKEKERERESCVWARQDERRDKLGICGVVGLDVTEQFSSREESVAKL